MKHFILIVFVLLSCIDGHSVNANDSAGNVRLIISLKKCSGGKRDYSNCYVTIFKNADSIRQVLVECCKPLTVDQLDTGVYYLEYSGIFDPHCRVRVEAKESGDYPVVLCTDAFQRPEEFPAIIDSMRKGDQWKIVFMSRGCFHYTQDSLLVIKNATGYVVTHGARSHALDSNDIEALRDFEFEVNAITREWGGCTTSDLYIFSLNGEEYFRGDDATCRWSGFSLLLARLQL